MTTGSPRIPEPRPAAVRIERRGATRRMLTAAILMLAVASAIAALTYEGSRLHEKRAVPVSIRLARQAGRTFLSHYVAADGHVVRHDQDGDTVSEGQAYAM